MVLQKGTPERVLVMISLLHGRGGGVMAYHFSVKVSLWQEASQSEDSSWA
jgi:hypothetical protein